MLDLLVDQEGAPMSYGVMYTVPAPIEMYDAVHAETMKHPADGLTMHLARKVDGGFQVIEVWESKEQHDRFNAEVVGPIVVRLAGADAAGPAPEEFDVHTLVVPSAVIG
jgi:hypothetical protein